MLFFRIDEQDWSTLTTFLIFLERMPETVPEYKIVTADVALDETVIQALRKL
jgi:hypothetical protein